MRVTYELQLTDLQAADRFFAARRPRLTARDRLNRAFFLLLVAPFIAVPLLAIPLSYIHSPAFKTAWKLRGMAALWPVSFVLIPVLFFAILWLAAPLLRGHGFRQSPLHGRQITLSIEPDGLRGEKFAPWSQLRAVQESPAHIFVVFDENLVFAIPRRAFESDFAATQFAARCRDRQPEN